MKQRSLRAGDRIYVRTPEEILATLDADGTLDGLPFMPEMLDWCEKPYRVERRVEKTCFYASGHIQPMRRFPANDVVMLDGPRCGGEGHDGCKRACRVFWKEAWLRPIDASAATTPQSTAGLSELRARLKVKSDATHYFCQSTELGRATETFPGRQKPWILRIAFREVVHGDLSLLAVLKMFALWFDQKVRRALAGDGWLRGPHARTPSETLHLKPGEVVRIKSRAEIVATLDNKRRNRGMGMCYEVTRCCGHEAEVRYRVDRIIDEQSGEMRDMRDTVALGAMRGEKTLGEECLCYAELGDCPRGELMYWREIWLERVDGGIAPGTAVDARADESEGVPVGR
jgi:hypothetical protein